MTQPRYVTDAQNMAAAVRQQMRLGVEAVANIFHLIEESGLPVARRNMGDDGPDGLYANSGSLAVAVINTSRPRNRQRFTAAHELGHHLFDYGPGLQVDSDIFQLKAQREKKANAFAAHFLMPEDGILSLLSKDRQKLHVKPQDIVHLSYHFGVSNEAITYQMNNIGIINASQRNKLLEMNKDDTLKAVAWECGFSPKQDRHHEKLFRLPTDFVKRAIESYVNGKISILRLAEFLERPDTEVLKKELEAAKIFPVDADVDGYREDVELA